jgi:hypothetical protein
MTPFIASGFSRIETRYGSSEMATNPPGPTPSQAQTRFSPDGFWWWDGREWKPAMSTDRMWRWNGTSWVPAAPAPPPPTGGSGGGLALILVLSFVGVVVLVAFVVLVILLTMGNQIANVFSNVAAALGS